MRERYFSKSCACKDISSDIDLVWPKSRESICSSSKFDLITEILKLNKLMENMTIWWKYGEN